MSMVLRDAGPYRTSGCSWIRSSAGSCSSDAVDRRHAGIDLYREPQRGVSGVGRGCSEATGMQCLVVFAQPSAGKLGAEIITM